MDPRPDQRPGSPVAPAPDDRHQRLRRARLASRGVLALGTAGALGASGALALVVIPGTGTEQGQVTPADQDDDGWRDRLLPGQDDPGERRDADGWAAPDRGVAPGGGASPQGRSSGS